MIRVRSMRSLFTLSCLVVACSPATQSLTMGVDKSAAVANGTDGVIVSATRTMADGTPVSDFVDFTVTSGGTLSTMRVKGDTAGVAKTTVTATAAGPVTVSANVPGMQSLTGSVTVTFTAASAPRLRFQTSPSNTQSQNLLRPIPVVVVEDGNGMTNTTSTASVTVAVTPGSCSAQLDATSMMTVSAVQGVASFYGLKITTPVTGCTLTATSGSLQAAVSTAFDIVP